MMISAWHLIWIVPLAGGLGSFATALFSGVRILEMEMERQRKDES